MTNTRDLEITIGGVKIENPVSGGLVVVRRIADAAEFNVCRWLCCRSVAEERADAAAHLDETADRYDCQGNRGIECEACVRANVGSELSRGEHVGAASRVSEDE